MNRKQGFTLVELLVVIAIITILASIVVPRVTDAIGRSRMAKAASEIRGAELAVTKMLADCDKQAIDKFFAPGALHAAVINAVNNGTAAEKVYSDIFYELLRRGKGADLTDFGLNLVDTVRRKLGSSYMDMPRDPWGTHPYYFFAGPLKGEDMYRFRCYREDGYVYNVAQRQIENQTMRGNPGADDLAGFPCPTDLPVYIFSYGGDETCNQRYVNNDIVEGNSGGDDVNNWDNAGGWSAFY